jgi:hypothetical protein
MNVNWHSLRPEYFELLWNLSKSLCIQKLSIQPIEITSSYIHILYDLTAPNQDLFLYFTDDDRLMRMIITLWMSHTWDTKPILFDDELDALFHRCQAYYAELRDAISSTFGEPIFSGTIGDPGYPESKSGADHVTIWWQDTEHFMLEWTFIERNDPITIDFSCQPKY